MLLFGLYATINSICIDHAASLAAMFASLVIKEQTSFSYLDRKKLTSLKVKSASGIDFHDLAFTFNPIQDITSHVSYRLNKYMSKLNVKQELSNNYFAEHIFSKL